MNFNFYMPSKLIFGRGSLNNLHKQKFPGKKALIVTEAIIKELGYLKMLEEQLNKANISYVLFDKIIPNPIKEHVMEEGKKYRNRKAFSEGAYTAWKKAKQYGWIDEIEWVKD